MRTALVLAISAALSRAALADDDLARAREREAALDYAGGLVIAEQAIARGGLDPVRWIDLHVLAGKLAGGLDRAAEAEGHFARALALRPDLALPEGTSPKITTPFAAARARTTPLAVGVRSVAGLITLEPERDPLGLVVGIAVHVVDDAGAHRDVVDRRALRIAIPAGTRATEVSALDVHRNRIWSGQPPVEPVEPVKPVNRVSVKRSWIARWPTWAAVGGVALVGGGLAAWRFSAAQDEWDRLRAEDGQHDFAELEAVEDRGRRWGLTANLAFGAAALAGAAAIVFYVRGDETERAVALTPGPGIGLGAVGRF